MASAKQLLGARIKELRKDRGLTQEQLAERVSLATRYISMIEVGRNAPSLEAIEMIAQSLGVELKALFDYAHLDPDSVAPSAMEQKLQQLPEDKRKLLYRIAALMAE